MIDHKAALRALAEGDGCKASLLAAAHIEYIERQVEKIKKISLLSLKNHEKVSKIISFSICGISYANNKYCSPNRLICFWQ
jgi:hypothetical protein